jgi:hypothetical protein
MIHRRPSSRKGAPRASLRKATLGFFGTLVLGTSILAVSLPANAALTSYFSGSAFQSQTHFTPIATISGGTVRLGLQFATAYHQTQGWGAVGTGPGFAEASHLPITSTRAYCYMNYGDQSFTTQKTCSYKSP